MIVTLGDDERSHVTRTGAQARTHRHGYTVRFVLSKGEIMGEGGIVRGMLWRRVWFGER